MNHYVEGSIYSATKDVTAEWLYEKIATGVNTLKVNSGTVDVSFGYGDTPEEAQDIKYTVPSGQQQFLFIAGSYVAWIGSVGTIFQEQSVARYG